MAEAALRWQSNIKWGTGSSATVEIELDASVFAKWRATDQATGVMNYYFYCWIGARQRGDASKFAIMPLGVSSSDDVARVNPETSAAYRQFCDCTFGSQSAALVSMTDGAPAYQRRCAARLARFAEHHWVNHSRCPRCHKLVRKPMPAGEVRRQRILSGRPGGVTDP